MGFAMGKRKIDPRHVGSSLDDFLKEEGLLEEVNYNVQKRIIAMEVEAQLKAKRMTKVTLAKRLGTSRAQLDRILDPTSSSITLDTLLKIAEALGKKLEVRFV
jgi:antitoxin HicB